MSDEPKRNEKGQWLPGQSGNVFGRPLKGETLADLIDKVWNETEEDIQLTDEMTSKERDVRRAILKMRENLDMGDISILKYLSERSEGKPYQTVYEHKIDEVDMTIIANAILGAVEDQEEPSDDDKD